MWILVDTNIFLDYLLSRGEQAVVAKEFFYNCRKTQSKTFIAATSLKDIDYVMHRYLHDKNEAKKAVRDVYSLVSKVISITADDAIESIYSDMNDYEDSLLVEAAKREMINLIVTNNVKDFKSSHFPVLSPKEFNDIINNQIPKS